MTKVGQLDFHCVDVGEDTFLVFFVRLTRDFRQRADTVDDTIGHTCFFQIFVRDVSIFDDVVAESDALKLFVFGLNIVHHLDRMQDVRIATAIELPVMGVGGDVKHLAKEFAFFHDVVSFHGFILNHASLNVNTIFVVKIAFVRAVLPSSRLFEKPVKFLISDFDNVTISRITVPVIVLSIFGGDLVSRLFKSVVDVTTITIHSTEVLLDSDLVFRVESDVPSLAIAHQSPPFSRN